MTVKVLGTGCTKCKKLEEHAKEAVAKLGLDIKVEKVEDIKSIMGYGVMMTPALVVNEEVKAVGKVLSVKEIIELIK